MSQNVIYKYPLEAKDEQVLSLPKGSELLHVDVQYGIVCIWVRCSQSDIGQRRILMRGTGHLIGFEPYIGSVLAAGGALVWHYFDGGEVA